ncbi:hypothetical protein ACOMHN_004883 [Nucella lapillus]
MSQKVTSSSVDWGNSQGLTDGRFENNQDKNVCLKTWAGNAHTIHWMMLDLVTTHQISRVIVWGRRQCCLEPVFLLNKLLPAAHEVNYSVAEICAAANKNIWI